MTSTEQRGVPEGLQPSPAGPQDSLWGASIALHSGSQEGSSKYSPQQPPPPAPFHLAAECKAGFDTWPRSFMLTRSSAGNVPPSWNSGQTDLCHRTVGCLQLQDCPGEAGLRTSSSSGGCHFLALCLHRCSLCSWPCDGGRGSRVHKDGVGVAAVQAGQVPLASLIHDVLGREAALGMERGGRDRQTALHLSRQEGVL